MRRYGLPVLPAVIGVILGPAAEQQLRRALQISDGSVTGLVNTPFAVTVYAVILVLLAWPWIKRLVVRLRSGPGPGTGIGAGFRGGSGLGFGAGIRGGGRRLTRRRAAAAPCRRPPHRPRARTLHPPVPRPPLSVAGGTMGA